MRALVVAPAFAPLGNPEAIVNSKLAVALQRARWDLQILSRDLTASSDYVYGSEWSAPFEELRGRVVQVVGGTGGKARRVVQLMRSAAMLHHGVAGSIWAWRAAAEAKRLHQEQPFDVVVTRSGPDSAHLVGLAMARSFRLPWVANWNDPHATKMPPPYGRGPHAWTGVGHWRLLRSVARRASWHTFPSARLRQYAAGFLGDGILRRSSVVPHVAFSTGPTHFADAARSTLVFCHAGDLSKYRNPAFFLHTLAELEADPRYHGRVEFRVCGLVAPHVASIAASLGIAHVVRYLGRQSYASSLQVMAQSDVLLLIEAPCDEGVFLPSKLTDYAQVGKPVLAVSPAIGTVADLLKAHGGGIAADCTDASSVEKAVRQLADDWMAGRLNARYRGGLLDAFSEARVLAELNRIAEAIGVVPGSRTVTGSHSRVTLGAGE